MVGTAATKTKTKIRFEDVFISSSIPTHKAIHEEQLCLHRFYFNIRLHQRSFIRLSSL